MAGWTKSKAAGKNGAEAFFVKSGFWLQVLFILLIKIGIWCIVSLRVETKWPNYMLLSYTLHPPPLATQTTDCRNTAARLNYKRGTLQENWRKIITFIPSLADLDWVHICMVLFAFVGKHWTEIRGEQIQIFWQEKGTSSSVGLINAVWKELVSTVPFLFGIFVIQWGLTQRLWCDKHNTNIRYTFVSFFLSWSCNLRRKICSWLFWSPITFGMNSTATSALPGD